MVLMKRKFLVGAAALACSTASAFPIQPLSSPPRRTHSSLAVSAATEQVTSAKKAKAFVVKKLQEGEDNNSEELKPFLDALQTHYEASGIDARTSTVPNYNGDWSNIDKPAFPSRLGFDEDGFPLYKVGSLTFGLLKSGADVVCTVDRMVQRVQYAEDPPDSSVVPTCFVEALENNPDALRTNHIDTVFRVPASEGIPEVQGTLRMEGYTLPNQDNVNRYDTWFVRGHCIQNENTPLDAFAELFGSDTSKHSYNLAEPVTAYQTVLYLDEDFRVSIGNQGSLMINGSEDLYS